MLDALVARSRRWKRYPGNVDDRHDPMLPRERTMPVGGSDAARQPRRRAGQPDAELLLARYAADILVYGHTHRRLVLRAADGRLVVNPGAAGPRRFNLEAKRGAADHRRTRTRPWIREPCDGRLEARAGPEPPAISRVWDDKAA